MISKEQIQQIIALKNQQERKSLQISIARLSLAIVCVVALFSGYYMKKEYLYIVSLISVLLFCILVKIHTSVLDMIQYLQTKEYVLQRYIDRSSDAWKKFEQDGSEYKDRIHGPVKDLDILGKNSLYQRINIATSSRGKKILIDKLTRKKFTKAQIEKEQKAIQELYALESFVIDYEIAGNQIVKQSIVESVLEKFITKVETKNKYQSIGLLKYIIPVITITAGILALFQIAYQVTVIIVAIMIFGQWISTACMLYKNSEIFKQIIYLSDSFQSYQKRCSLIEKQNFKDLYLCSLQKQIKQDKNASEAMKELASISDAIKQRGNIIAFIVCNGLLLWDMHCRERYYTWIATYGKQLAIWLDTMGEFEALISLQTIMHTSNKLCFPVIKEDSPLTLSFKDCYHPLLDERVAIKNDFVMNKQSCVITGSNMSGKTTFLRTIGLNLVLAYAGGPVHASTFTCSLMEIFTSMRIEDDVSNGISTFYGELLRVKEMVEASKTNVPMIALIDEIFKGTNSKDRIIGATETIKRLTKPHMFTFITTHDFELCELEQQVSCSNYHFEEYYEDNKIKFDYKIKDGRSSSTNAQYLLKMVGIIE